MHRLLAQTSLNLPGGLGRINFPTGKANLDPNSGSFLTSVAIDWLVGLAGALAVLSVIYSGIMYMTAGGDPKKSETAKKNLTWAITGLVVFLLAASLVTWVDKLLNGIL